MQLHNPMRLIRELKGAPLSIYLILGLAGQRVSQEYLERMTGYTDKPVSNGLAYLEEIGLVVKGRGGWALAAGAVQLPLPAEELPAGDLSTSEDQGNGEMIESEPVDPADDENESRNISDSLITTTNIDPLINYEDELVVVINAESRSFSDFFHERRAALGECGVEEPKLTRLAGLQDLSAEDIFNLEAELRKTKGKRYTVGLLIYALEHGQRPKNPYDDWNNT